jgi:uroporphyrinogen-III synthase
LPVPEPRFDCLLITRPRPEASELAGRLAGFAIQVIIQPAFEFAALQASAEDIAALQQAVMAPGPVSQRPLLVFTSTRAVEFALPQLPSGLLQACQLAAIGPATAASLQAAGLGTILQPGEGYTSEDLLRSIGDSAVQPRQAFILAAEGGRKALLQGLQHSGAVVRELFVYARQPAAVLQQSVTLLNQSQRVLSVWTSFNAMQQLASSLPAAAWQRVCTGDWLVVSPRLAEQAAGLHAARVHECKGPGNAELAACVHKLCAAQ